jgi:hypothetical protein
VQLSLNFLPSPQPENPVSRLSPEQRAELVEGLARIIAKTIDKSAKPELTTAASANKEADDDE